MTRLQTPFLAAALFAGLAAGGLTPALAQTAPAPTAPGAASGGARQQERARMMPGEFVDGAHRVSEGGAQDRAGAGGAVAEG